MRLTPIEVLQSCAGGLRGGGLHHGSVVPAAAQASRGCLSNEAALLV